MADEPNTPRTFTEGEAYALVDQAVTRETAAAKTEIEGLQSANAELSTKVDVLETEKAAAISRAEAAEQAHADYKAEIEQAAAREAKRDERKRQVAEANPALDLSDSEAGKARLERIVAMDDEVFEGYLGDMREAASAAGVVTPPPATPGAPPRESAAFTPTPTATGDEKKASVASLSAARRNLGKGA